jgi:hypothetical protein
MHVAVKEHMRLGNEHNWLYIEQRRHDIVKRGLGVSRSGLL